ncbi:MAG: hypothetical protein Q4F13_02445 [Pseudomonadota bacterium]|nr:hypothetical protein [Pseudomonadota bacterium]
MSKAAGFFSWLKHASSPHQTIILQTCFDWSMRTVMAAQAAAEGPTDPRLDHYQEFRNWYVYLWAVRWHDCRMPQRKCQKTNRHSLAFMRGGVNQEPCDDH